MNINIDNQLNITHEKEGGEEIVLSVTNNTKYQFSSMLLTLIGCTSDLGGTP